jgi:uncharacterized protein
VSAFFRERWDGIELLVRLTPKSSADRIEGIGELSDGRRHLKARVRAVPESGKANKALEKLIAEAFGVPHRDVAVTAGGTSRLKTVAITGDPAALLATLDTLAGIAG